MTTLCPICRRPAQADSRPFCSLRCSEVDLGRWLLGAYAVPDLSDDEGESEAADGSGAAG
jgi:endogenous inhibitor of DNA gyrase (YacG/DUF329 family)